MKLNKSQSKLGQDDATIPSEPKASYNINYEQATKIKLLPPLYLREIIDFVGLRNQLKSLISSQNFILKSSTNNLKCKLLKLNFIENKFTF